MNMESKVVLPENICDDEVVDYLAQRYHTTPSRVIARFLEQDGIISTTPIEEHLEFQLTPNEMEIFRDMGMRPSKIEFTKQ
jgi:hypothetical protein